VDNTYRRSMPKNRPGYRWLVIGGTLSIALIALVIIFADRKELLRMVSRTQWDIVPWALLLGLISYLSLSGSFLVVYRIFKVDMPSRDLMEVGFVSVAVSNVTFFGGAPEYLLRVLLMKPRGLPASVILGASAMHSYVKDGLYIIGAPVGVAYMLTTGLIKPSSGLVGGTAVFAVFVVLISLAIFLRPIRRGVMSVLNAVWLFLTRHRASGFFNRLDEAMEDGLAGLKRSRSMSLVLLVLIACDWVAVMASLHFCYQAVGLFINPTLLVLGYVTARAAGAASFLPGGAGVQEASMAAILSVLGQPFVLALLGAILFRLVYYFLPFGISLIFYRSLLHKAVGTLESGVSSGEAGD
jgi:uncharacterized protein (TIRG00374 family)